jgi:hypothetical protein
VLDSGLWDSICHQVNVGTTENELSPLGLLTAVRILYGNSSKKKRGINEKARGKDSHVTPTSFIQKY